MEVIYGLIPSVIIVGILVVLAIIWAAKKGQFDDLDGAGSRILMSDDDQPFADPNTNLTTEPTTKDKTSV
jgi:cbb3-type cytochrome oxidase maturation protein